MSRIRHRDRKGERSWPLRPCRWPLCFQTERKHGPVAIRTTRISKIVAYRESKQKPCGQIEAIKQAYHREGLACEEYGMRK